MSKEKKSLPKLFELEYLAKEDLTENDLYYIFETDSLLYSLIQAQYRMTGEFTSMHKIIKDIHHDNGWVHSRHFKYKHDREQFIKLATKAIMNIYQYSEYLSKRWVDDFMFRFGFTVKNINICNIWEEQF